MPSYLLKLSPLEVVRILQAETKRAHGAPELDTSAGKEYEIEEDFDRAAFGLADGEKYNLVTSVATLNIEGRVEQNYWVLESTVSRMVGPVPASEESSYGRVDMTPEEFEAELRAPGPKQAAVRLRAETPFAKEHFDNWLAEMRRRHASAAKVEPFSEEEMMTSQDQTRENSSTVEPTGATSWIFGAREVVAVFSDPDKLEAAVDELEISGFDRSAVSVLALGPDAKTRIEGFYHKVEDIEDRNAPRAAFVSRDSRTEGEAAAIALPSYVGGVAGAWAVIAAGGALAPAFAAAIAAGAIGAGIGGLLASAMARRYSDRIREELGKGGIALWVNVRDAEAEKRALAILEKMDGMHVHAHAIQREWSIRDIPSKIPSADPFLEPDPQIED